LDDCPGDPNPRQGWPKRRLWGSTTRLEGWTTRLAGPKPRFAGPKPRFAGPNHRLEGSTIRLAGRKRSLVGHISKPMTVPPALQRLVDRLLRWPPVVRLQEILAAYNEAGGGLLAAGLAFSALFAGLTGLLFAVGLTGFVVNDSGSREKIVGDIARQVPPLEPIVRDGLLKMAGNAGAFSVLGIAGLGWSASQFYGTVDAAFGRIFKKVPERGLSDRIVRGLVSVVIVVGALAAGIVTSSVQAFLERDAPPVVGDAARFVTAVAFPAITVVLVVVAVSIVYRLVPNTHVPWSVLGPPALLTGLVLAGLTEAFVFIAPRLVGSLEIFGGFAAVFAALIWLNWAFQILLIGAAWTRERLPEDSPPGPKPEEVLPQGATALG
jgi:membrane protein